MNNQQNNSKKIDVELCDKKSADFDNIEIELYPKSQKLNIEIESDNAEKSALIASKCEFCGAVISSRAKYCKRCAERDLADISNSNKTQYFESINAESNALRPTYQSQVQPEKRTNWNVWWVWILIGVIIGFIKIGVSDNNNFLSQTSSIFSQSGAEKSAEIVLEAFLKQNFDQAAPYLQIGGNIGPRDGREMFVGMSKKIAMFFNLEASMRGTKSNVEYSTSMIRKVDSNTAIVKGIIKSRISGEGFYVEMTVVKQGDRWLVDLGAFLLAISSINIR